MRTVSALSSTASVLSNLLNKFLPFATVIVRSYSCVLALACVLTITANCARRKPIRELNFLSVTEKAHTHGNAFRDLLTVLGISSSRYGSRQNFCIPGIPEQNHLLVGSSD